MDRMELGPRLYLSTIGADAPEQARVWGAGLEIAEYCTAYNMDREYRRVHPQVLASCVGVGRFWFHAPFSEMCPAAVDPKVRQITADRYRQAIRTAGYYGVHRLVIHGGFVPLVYFPEWFVEQSVDFWRKFLKEQSENLLIALENVMEPEPEMLVRIVREVDDPRLRLCLDVGHANTFVSSRPLEEWVDKSAPWLAHVHLHNNAGQMDLHDPLGRGGIPMEAILDRLLEKAPAATFTIENQLCAPSMEWLAERGYLRAAEKARQEENK